MTKSGLNNIYITWKQWIERNLYIYHCQLPNAETCLDFHSEDLRSKIFSLACWLHLCVENNISLNFKPIGMDVIFTFDNRGIVIIIGGVNCGISMCAIT